MSQKMQLVADAISHKQSRRLLASVMVQPIRGPNKNGNVFKNDGRSCQMCGRYMGKSADECDWMDDNQDLPKDCFCPKGTLLVWGEQLV